MAIVLKIDQKALIRDAKAKNKPDRANVTFRLETEIYSDFKAICEKHEIKEVAVIEALLKAFIDG